MEYESIKKFVENKLSGLSENLTYHCAWHTIGDVLPAVERLSVQYNECTSNTDIVNEHDLILLKTAVLFHDLGYLEQYENNESIGALMAEQCLAEFNYSNEQINTVSKLIYATQVPQKPVTLLEEIICDADLDSLGRDDFIQLSKNLLQEFNWYRNKLTMKKWITSQLDFMATHSYHTEAARTLRNAGKLKNITSLELTLSTI